VAASLLIRSFSRLTSCRSGFPDRWRARVSSLAAAATYQEDANRVTFYDAFLERLEATPEVTGVGMVQTLPLRGD
jgi:hypothetical protein